MMVCQHCGASWDAAHERGDCGVAAATERILTPHPPEKAGTLTINGDWAGVADGKGVWVGGRLRVAMDGSVHWEKGR